MPTLLAIIPHPDDESYSFGGTIALAARSGWRCLVECATAGECGKRHDGGLATEAAIGRARIRELRDSCRILRAEHPRVWGLPDGGLSASVSAGPHIADLLHDLAPDLVLTLGPDGAYGHPDHIALHDWVRDAWLACPEPRPALLWPVFPPGLFLPQYDRCRHMLGDPPSPAPGEVGSDTFDYEVPIATVAAIKRDAIAAHRTQLPGADPQAIFPPGIVAALMASERFSDAYGSPQPRAAAMLRNFLP